ncbi:slipin family protein [Methylobacterium tardum]|uniref:slipin family protein n=1 Tax=Methylobacterium tardum TaxID=374432 RepID=UPI001EE0D4F4|nr:slipin family protein [Methylobacterium tardum]
MATARLDQSQLGPSAAGKEHHLHPGAVVFDDVNAIAQSFSQGAGLFERRTGQRRRELTDVRCHVRGQQSDLDPFIEGLVAASEAHAQAWFDMDVAHDKPFGKTDNAAREWLTVCKRLLAAPVPRVQRGPMLLSLPPHRLWGHGMDYAIVAAIAAVVMGLALKTLGINQEYERAVLFRLGRLGTTKGPGWYWLIPFVDRVVKVDTRTITVQLETQETITRDGVAVKVNAVLWYRAVDPARVVTAVESWRSAIIQAAETGMRDAIGQSDLDQMLKDRVAINKRLLELLSTAAERWGIEIDAVEIKDVDIPEQMQRAIAREAEAIREKRARIIKAEGENEAAQKLAEAAAMIATAPGALELRRLQTLTEIGVEHNSTIIAMLPVELLHAAGRIAGLSTGSAE